MAVSLLVAAGAAREAEAAGEPRIEFLNPSSFSARPDVGILVGDAETQRPQLGTATYRISAWTANAPPNAGAEFELLQSGVSLDTIDTVVELDFDTYEAKWNIPDALPDGPYTLRATLFENNEAIDSVDQDIIINKSADRMEMTYPSTLPGALPPADGSFATFAPLATALPEKGLGERGLPVGNIDGNHTGLLPGSGTGYVRTFYTVSAPGTVPEWIPCGTEGAPGNSSLSGAANAGVRCTLTKPVHQTTVTAVAAVANSSKQGFNATLNGVGDATRVTEAYAQAPASISLLDGSSGQVVESDDEGHFGCHEATVHVSDSRGREVLGANIDVHASGPTDKLRFDTGLLSAPSDFQVPDRQSHAVEPGYDCFTPSERSGDSQAEHQILGGPDIKHVESGAAGTEDTGNWSFAVWIPQGAATAEAHTTQFTAWVDETDDDCVTNDDRYTSGELAASGTVGWDGAPTAVTPAVPTTLLGCVPPIEGLAPRDLAMQSDAGRVKAGNRVHLSGDLSSTYDVCSAEQLVKLKWRRGKRNFRTIQELTTSATGEFETYVSPKRAGKHYYKAVAPRGESCKKAITPIVRVKAF